MLAVAALVAAGAPGGAVRAGGAASAAVVTAEPDGTSLRVATANISTRLPTALFEDDLVRTYASRADLVALNEVGARSTEQLQRSGYRVFRDEDARGQGRSTAVAWQGARWEQVTGGRLVLVRRGPQRWDAGRSATWATLRGVGARQDTGVVSLVSVHHMINPARWGPRQPWRRSLYRRGMRRLGVLVTHLSSSGPVVVAGDFNSQWRADDPWGPRRRLGAGVLGEADAMTDSMSVLGHTLTHDAGGTVDYVFFQPSRATATAQRTEELSSDHRLLSVDLLLR